jgi:hypothetical protein
MTACKIKTLIIIYLVVLGLFIFSPFSQADKVADAYPFVYLFHLYYDNGKLLADRDFEFKYDLIAEEFTPETISTDSPYKGEVVSIKGSVLATFSFDPRRDNPNFKAGKISVKGPYFADAARVNFYDGHNRLLLTIDVWGSSFCNDDGICNEDVGEDYKNCPNDCKGASLSPSISQPPVAGGKPSPLVFIIIAAAIIVIAVLIIWVIIKKRKTTSQNQNLPPVKPLS